LNGRKSFFRVLNIYDDWVGNLVLNIYDDWVGNYDDE